MSVRKIRERFYLPLLILVLSLPVLLSGCGDDSQESDVPSPAEYRSDGTVPAVEAENKTEISPAPEIVHDLPAEANPEKKVSSAPVSEAVPEAGYVKPFILKEEKAEVFLESRLIPGKPRVIVYRIKEKNGSSPQSRPSSVDTAEVSEKAAIKPEPVIPVEKKETAEPEPEPDNTPVLVISEPPEKTDDSEVPSSAENAKAEKPEPDNSSGPAAIPEPPEKTDSSAAPPAEEEPDMKEEPHASAPVTAEHTAPEPVIQADAAVKKTIPEKKTVPPAGDKAVPLPYLKIMSPSDGSYYTDKVRIEGRVSNSESDVDSAERIEKVTWEIPGKKNPEELFFGSDGIFLLDFSTRGFSGVLDIVIRAVDKTGTESEKNLRLFDGNTPPELVMVSPVDGTSYGAILRIEGKVKDLTASDMGRRCPDKLEYAFFSDDKTDSKEERSGEINISPEGVFKADILTGDLSGTQTIRFSVRGINGKIFKTSVTLSEAEGSIPGFELSAGEKSAVISWDPLPGADTYDLYYSTGTGPAFENKKLLFKNVVSPVELKNLKEGVRYNFILSASVGTGENKTVYWSDVKKMVALTPGTLKPLVTGEYNHINLVWLKIPGCDEFDIYRKTEGEGDFSIIRKGFSGTTYTDSDVRFGKRYSYSIRPSGVSGIRSDAVSGTTLEFPEEKTLTLNRFEDDNLRSIQIKGSYLFLAGGPSGVKIVDITDKNKPVETGWFNTFDAEDIFVRGERAYVADGEKGLKILDISSPREPVLIGSRKTINARSLVVKGDTVFIADGTSGIKIMDISSERRPVRLGSIRTENAVDLSLQGGYLYAADRTGGVKIFRITNSSSLVPAGTIQGHDVVSVAVEGSLLAAADYGNGIILADISDRDNPREMRVILDASVTDCTLEDNYLYYTSEDNGLSIYEVSDPRRPVLFDSVRRPGARGVETAGGIVYAITSTGYEAFRSFTTGQSFVVAEFRTKGKAYSITAKRNFLFLADHRNGVKIVNTGGDSSNEFSLEGVIPASFAESVFIRDGKLFIADGSGGLKTADITIKDGGISIGQVRSVDLPGKSKSVTVIGDYAYISSREEGINILDLKTRKVRNLSTGNTVHQIAAGKGFIYTAEGSGGVGIYSTADPWNPEPVSFLRLKNVTSIVMYNDRYAVAGGEDGIAVIDISASAKPAVVSRYKTEWVEDLFSDGKYLYIAAGSEGLLVMDIKNPREPELVSTCADVYAAGVDVDGNIAYVADIDGFKVVKILIPSWLRR